MVLNRYMGHLRKLALTEVGRACVAVERVALIAVIVVHWNLVFRQTYDEKPTETKREKVFYDEREAQAFYDHRPKPGQLFECINSLTAMPGLCEVKEVAIAGLRDPFKDHAQK